MKSTRQTRYLYLIVILTFAAASYYFIRNRQLERRLDEIEKEKIALEQQRIQQERLLQIDSMLVVGENYQDALLAYNDQLDQQPIEDNYMSIELRMALTKKLQRLHYENTLSLKAAEAASPQDSLELSDLDDTNNRTLQQLDSIGFALEKTKVKLARAQRQLQQKASGEYLTFRTSKGSQLHYVGQVKDGKANGYGVAILSTGSRYEGEWKDNRRHGQGSFYWPDGQYYVGAYRNDKRNGEGTYYWPNGEKFVGLWENDERTGEGVFYGKKGDVVASGLWEDDELIVVNKSSDK